MSAPEAPSGDNAGVTVAEVSADVIEIATLRERQHVLKTLAARRGLTLPERGRVAAAHDTLMLCVRPQRWLIISRAAGAGVAAAHWQEVCAGVAAAVDLSSALLALRVCGPNAGDALARGCRLDLHAAAFPRGSAAATIIAQVSAIIAALPSGFLLLTPATTGRHFREWLSAAARPFGLAAPTNVTVAGVSGEHST